MLWKDSLLAGPRWVRLRFVLGCGLLLATLAGAPSAFAGPGTCLPDPGPGHVYLCDSLEEGSSQSGEVVGGSFGTEGWKTAAFGDHIHYDLGSAVSAGTLSVWVRGIAVSATSLNNDNHHLVEMFDQGGHGGPDVANFLAGVRVFGMLADPAWIGKVKFFFGSRDATCPGEANLAGWDTSVWQEDPWHHIEIDFGASVATMRFDDAQVASIHYETCPVVLRQLYVPNNPWVQGAIDSVDGAEYADVSFVGTSACVDPCDDGNPCTSGDSCSAGACEGNAVADGTPCVDQGSPGTCASGTCQKNPPVDAGPEAAADAAKDGIADGIADDVVALDAPSPETSTPDANDGSGPKPDDAGAGSTSTPSGSRDDDGGCGCRLVAPGPEAPGDQAPMVLVMIAAAAVFVARARE